MSELRPAGAIHGSVAGHTGLTGSLTTLCTVTFQGRMWGPFATPNGILELNRTRSVAGGMAAQ